ncbi:hypothetical protein IKD60_02475, partial [Candidatus Saccharibacteria bacterium]|nr:hypothetical protein [Candidatus Saccharibacteria bacterium]
MKAEHKGRCAALFLYWCMIGVLIMNTYGNTSVLAAEEIESVADTVTLEETSDGSLSDSRDNVCVEEDEALKPDTWEATEAMSNMDLSEEVAVDNTVLTSQNYSETIIDYFSDDDV